MPDTPSSYPAQLEIAPLTRPPQATISVPGSKSITNRALVLAALSHPVNCELEGALLSEDTQVMMNCLHHLGFYAALRRDLAFPVLKVFSHDPSRLIPASSADLFVGNSGTTVRFLTALLGLGQGRFRLDGVPRMRERPIEDLLGALRQLGVSAGSENRNGCPPVVVEAKGLQGGQVRVKGDVSSQFLSGLLLAAPFAAGDTVIAVDGPLVSQPYVDLTVAMLRQWGKTVEVLPNSTFRIRGNQFHSRPGKFRVSDRTRRLRCQLFFGAPPSRGLHPC